MTHRTHKKSKPFSVELRIGGSCTMRAPHLVEEDSMLHNKPTFETFLVTPRTTLYNTRCWFYHNHPDGCKKGDACPFLHDEVPLCQPIFHNGNEQPRTRDIITTKPTCAPAPIQPGPVVDAVIYMKNLPPRGSGRLVEEIAQNLGTVVKIELLKSNLRNGRRSGFLHMTSEAQAKAVIDAICATQVEGERLFAKLQRVDKASSAVLAKAAKAAPPAPPPVARKSPAPDDEGWTTAARPKQSAAKHESSPVAQAKPTVWSLLDELDQEGEKSEESEESEESEVEEEPVVQTPAQSRIRPMPALEPDDSPDSVLGFNPWRESERSMRLRNELAHLRIEEVGGKPTGAFVSPTKSFKLDQSPSKFKPTAFEVDDNGDPLETDSEDERVELDVDEEDETIVPTEPTLLAPRRRLDSLV